MSDYQHETWYILADGTPVDPNTVAPDDDGILRADNGAALALHEDGTPKSVGMSGGQAKRRPAAPAPAAAREMKPEPKPVSKPKPGYKTRKA